jgi:sialic acid synthase SpsE/D-lyxose ketol-isomerase
MSSTLKNLIILEIANNHMGDVQHGINLIDTYSKICDKFQHLNFAFKFQYRDLETFIHKSLKGDLNNHYVKRFSETKLTEDNFNVLVQKVKANGFQSMVTPFDNNSLKLILKQDIDILKVASCSFTDWPLLEDMIKINKPIVASTAGATEADIDNVISFFENRDKDFAIMHCVAEYPTKNKNLNLSQIDYLKTRYADKTIGYSTHEDPDNFSFVSMAVAKGAKIFEKHVGLPTDQYPINKYSVSPYQFEKWLNSLSLAIEVCGQGEKRTPTNHSEQDSLNSLRRGIFAKKKINKGDIVLNEDIYFAFPPIKDQFTANDYSKYSSFKAMTEINIDEAVTKDNSSITHQRLVLEKITKQVNKLINAAEIHLPSSIQMEISHHYGLEKFNQFGMVIFTLINRTYCKKLLISLPGQIHPAQYHKKKEESFMLVYGDLTLTINDKDIKMELGQIITIEKGVTHKFSSKTGSIVEEISDTHTTQDSYYIDDKITQNKNRKTIINFYKNL